MSKIDKKSGELADYSPVFERQNEANNYIDSIQNTKEKLLVTCALSQAMLFLIRDEDYQKSLSNHKEPLDLFTYVQAIHAFLSSRNVPLLLGILTEKYKTIEEVGEDYF